MVWRNCKASIGASAIYSHMLEAEGHAADFLVEGEALMVAASQAAGQAVRQATEAVVAVAERRVEAEEAITRVTGRTREGHSNPELSKLGNAVFQLIHR